MNFLEAQNEMLIDTNDNSNENRERVKIWLNRSMRKILAANRSWAFLMEEDTASISDSNVLTLPDEVRWMYVMKDVEGTSTVLCPLPRRVLEDMFPDREQSGTISHYSVVPPNQVLFNAKDTADLSFIYYRRVADLSSDDDMPPWESEWDHVWLSGAMYYAYKFLDRPEEVALEIREFLKGVARMKAHDTISIEDSAPFRTKYLIPARLIYPHQWRYLGH